MNISTNGQQGGVSLYNQTRMMKQELPEYCCDFKMDIVKQGTERILWMHKDEQEQQQ